MKRKLLKISILLTWMSLSFIACGGSGDNAPAPAASDSSTTNGAKNAQDNPLSPGNLPPPGSDSTQADVSSLGSNTNLFFQRKELWDSFSEPLKTKVLENYAHSGDMVGAGPGGHGYYNTIFGRVSPKKASAPSTSNIETNKSQYFYRSSQRMFLMEKMAALGTGAQTCDFLCIISPEDKLNTIYDSVIVSGLINMDKVAIFSPSDPVLMMSVFKQTGEAVAQDIPIYPTDIATTQVTPPSSGSGSESQPAEPPKPVDIGVFNKTLPLVGPGEYTVVITSFEKDSNGEVIPHADYFTIYRQDVPKIELLTLTPPDTGNQLVADPAHTKDPIKKYSDFLQSEYEVSMTDVVAVVKVSAASPDALDKNVGILFQNYDSTGKLLYSSSGELKFSTVSTYVPEISNDQTPAKKAILPLFEGENKFVVTSHNQQLDDFYASMGLTPPPPQIFKFTIKNTLPHANIKLINPTDGSILEPTGNGNETIKVSFCMTDLPAIHGNTASQLGECVPHWNGEQPLVNFNNVEYGKSATAPIAYDATTGIYSIQVTPLLGANIITVSVSNKNYIPPTVTVTTSPDPKDPTKTITTNTSTPNELGNTTASFIYGHLNKISENGKLNETDNLLTRGLSLRIDRKIITGDVKRMLEKYLNQESFKQSLRDIFKKNDSSAPIVCTKTGVLSVDHGDTTINFLPEGFNIGNIVVNQIEPKSDNRLYVDVLIQGFHGEADLRGFNAPVKVVIGDKDASFVPISVWIKELHAKIALRFVKENGLNKLLIEKQTDSQEAVTLVGDGPMGNVAHVNSTRNPLAAGLEAYDAQTGLLSKSFKDTLQSTVLCGVEGGLNNKDSGLPRWDVDLLKLTAYNNLNPFRMPLEFTLLNKLVGLDIAYDILRGDINFGYQSVTLSNIPLRFTPSPTILTNLANQFKDKVLGSLSMPMQNPESPASLPTTDENKNISLSLSEDAINQALFAATAAGMLNIDIDPNFYTNHQIGFISLALPTVSGMFGSAEIDFNQNGVQDDKNLPVLLRLKADPLLPPAIHFLNEQERNNLAKQMLGVPQRNGKSANILNKNLHIFRLSLSDLELAFYQVEPYAAAQGGYKSFCSNTDNVDESKLADSELVRHEVDSLTVVNESTAKVPACSQKLSLTYENNQGTCGAGYTPFEAPIKNGAIVSAISGSPEVPMVRMKLNLVIHGVIQGVHREVIAADKYSLDPTDASKGIKKDTYSPTTFVRMKIVNIAPADPVVGVKITENHSSISPKLLIGHLIDTILDTALGSECDYFNEIRIPIPDSLFKDKTDMSDSLKNTLKDFGLDYVNLGLKDDQIPEIPFSDETDTNMSLSNPLYLDLRAHLGICYLNEDCK